MNVTVLPNRPPRAVGEIPDQTLELGGDEKVLSVESYFSDPDGNPLTYSAFSNHGRVSAVMIPDTPKVVLTPIALRRAIVRITAEDPGGRTAYQLFRVTVKPKNRPPQTTTPIKNQTLELGGGRHPVGMGPHFSDPDGDTLTYHPSSSNERIVTAEASDSVIWLTPKAVGTARVTVTARDPGDLTARQTFEVEGHQPARASESPAASRG